jgi:hypothetical protein
METGACEIWWSIDNFLLGFPAVAALGNHFAQ